MPKPWKYLYLTFWGYPLFHTVWLPGPIGSYRVYMFLLLTKQADSETFFEWVTSFVAIG